MAKLSKLPTTSDMNSIEIELWQNYYKGKINWGITNKNPNISIFDFLFLYEVDDNDNFILKVPTAVDFDNIPENTVIGRIYSLYNKHFFEIPDFILYNYTNHSGFKECRDGITPHLIICPNRDKPLMHCGGSRGWICLNTFQTSTTRPLMKPPAQFYENDILYSGDTIKQGYNKYFKMTRNILVNKEKKYGFIWLHKCASTTIGRIFCYLNNISTKNDEKMIGFELHKYQFHANLENDIQYIIVLRDPIERFVSTFADKNVKNPKKNYQYRAFQIYLDSLNGKPDTMENVMDYLEAGHSARKVRPEDPTISFHYTPMVELLEECMPNYKKEKIRFALTGNMNNEFVDFLIAAGVAITDVQKQYILSCRENENKDCGTIASLITNEMRQRIIKYYAADYSVLAAAAACSAA